VSEMKTKIILMLTASVTSQCLFLLKMRRHVRGVVHSREPGKENE